MWFLVIVCYQCKYLNTSRGLVVSLLRDFSFTFSVFFSNISYLAKYIGPKILFYLISASIASWIFNIPVVAVAVLQTPLSLNSLSIMSLTQWSFVKISSKHSPSQTVRARYLKCWDNVHHPLCVKWYTSLSSFNVAN